MKWTRLVFQIVCVVLLILATVQVLFSKNGARASDATHSSDSENVIRSHETANVSVELAQSLEQKKLELDKKEKDLAARESKLQVEMLALDDRIKQLEALRAGITGEFDKKRKDNEERVVKMVSVFETMSPKAAAGVLENLDDWLGTEVLKRMDVKRTAKIMNVMDKTRSAKLSELMTGYYRPDESLKGTTESSKGSADTSAGAGQDAPAKKPETSMRNTASVAGKRQ